MDLNKAAKNLDAFRSGSLSKTIADLERKLVGSSGSQFFDITDLQNVWESAIAIKLASSQISEIVHAVGILRALPKILQKGERVQCVSLGAGNTSKHFDLETDLRIAEFKFIDWKGTDSVRQDSVFKDFFDLAEYETPKQKFLYVKDLRLSMKVFNGGRSCKSVLARHKKQLALLEKRYGQQFRTAGDYYKYRAAHVKIVNLESL